MLNPLSLDIPSPETLMEGIVASEVAVLDETLVIVSTERMMNQLKVAHLTMDAMARKSWITC
jgi:hypothetical protein